MGGGLPPPQPPPPARRPRLAHTARAPPTHAPTRPRSKWTPTIWSPPARRASLQRATPRKVRLRAGLAARLPAPPASLQAASQPERPVPRLAPSMPALPRRRRQPHRRQPVGLALWAGLSGQPRARRHRLRCEQQRCCACLRAGCARPSPCSEGRRAIGHSAGSPSALPPSLPAACRPLQVIHLWPDNWCSPPLDTSFGQVRQGGGAHAAHRRRGPACKR